MAAIGELPLSQDGFGPTVEDVRKPDRQNRRKHVHPSLQAQSDGGNQLAAYHGSRIGVVVEFDGSEVAAKDVAMHIAAMKPVSLSSADVPAT